VAVCGIKESRRARYLSGSVFAWRSWNASDANTSCLRSSYLCGSHRPTRVNMRSTARGSAYTPALLTPRLCFLLPREAAAAVAAAKAVAEAAAAAERLRLEEVLAALATRMQSDALMMQQVQSQLGVPPAAPARHPETVTHLGHLSALATMSSMTSGLRQVRSASPRGRAPGG
jgi:hypothetical protein